MSGFANGTVNWTSEAELQMLDPRPGWAGSVVHRGTVAGCVNAFRVLSGEQKRRCDLFVGYGVVEGIDNPIFGFADLTILANRPDFPSGE